MISLVLVSGVLDALGGIVAVIDGRLKQLVLLTNDFCQFVNRLHGEVDLLD